MDGFRTARALVLDNDRNEAAPVIQALGSLGVAVLFHTGDDLEATKMRHKGVRLLVVDMVLENRGASSDSPKECASILVGTLGELISDDYHPIIVVCWTKHKEFKEDFEKAFRVAFPKLQFDSAILFEKERLLENPEELLIQIRKALEKTEPFALLLNWEQQVHDAATETSSEISRLVSEKRSGDETWGDLAYKVCAALAIAERGTRIAGEDDYTTLAALRGALNPLLLDRLELMDSTVNESLRDCAAKLLIAVKEGVDTTSTGTRKGCSLPENIRASLARLIEAVKAEVASITKGGSQKKGSLLPQQIQASLNSMLHLALPESSHQALPGTVWFVPASGDIRDKMGVVIPAMDWSALRGDKYLISLKVEPVPVLVEVTPPCDFAQDKAAVSRLLPGYLVKDEAGKFSIPAFVWELGPLYIKDASSDIEGVYRLILNAKYFSSVSRGSIINWKPIFRLRQSALSNLTAFIANHVSRVGFMKIEP